MKFAYLMYTDRDFFEISETISQLTKQDDHVFIMINDNSLRDKITIAFSRNKNVHVSTSQDYASVGDLSMSRGTILQLKESYERNDVFFDYYINLSDAMIPIKTREEIVEYLSNNPKDHYYIDSSETENPHLREVFEGYYTLTNIANFPTSKLTRNLTKGISKLLKTFNIQRKIKDKVFIGSPFFILKDDTVEKLAKHYDYVSSTFSMSWYSEEMYLFMMINKFISEDFDHINDDMRLLGPNGKWETSVNIQNVTREQILSTEALFAAKIIAEDNPSLYQDYYDIYNKNYVEEEEKEKEFDFKPIIT
ncbi:MAG: beta-1,6-N-acetylglucosaminyltransferase [Erysipelotrichaceae bacterium]|nr:beta-1,6-N-acetylglucosaminyltransferase [Erysipelotrichaceae bacterium]